MYFLHVFVGSSIWKPIRKNDDSDDGGGGDRELISKKKNIDRST